MAKPYPIVPASVLDELHNLNCTLGALRVMMQHSIRCFCTEGPPGDYESFLVGLDAMFMPVLEGYQSIESQVIAFREMGVDGICQLDPDVAPQADQE